MEIRVVTCLVEDTEIVDDINEMLSEGWVLRDTHVVANDVDTGRSGMLGIWLVAVLERNEAQD